MGVPIGDADGDHPALLECQYCGTEYETDETTLNDCPECGRRDFEIEDGGDPNGWRGDA